MYENNDERKKEKKQKSIPNENKNKFQWRNFVRSRSWCKKFVIENERAKTRVRREIFCIKYQLQIHPLRFFYCWFGRMSRKWRIHLRVLLYCTIKKISLTFSLRFPRKNLMTSKIFLKFQYSNQKIAYQVLPRRSLNFPKNIFPSIVPPAIDNIVQCEDKTVLNFSTQTFHVVLCENSTSSSTSRMPSICTACVKMNVWEICVHTQKFSFMRRPLTNFSLWLLWDKFMIRFEFNIFGERLENIFSPSMLSSWKLCWRKTQWQMLLLPHTDFCWDPFFCLLMQQHMRELSNFAHRRLSHAK